MRNVILVLAGMIAGAAIVVSCSDDSPSRVDAAVDSPPVDSAMCNCPAAEPPIAGRIVTASNTRVVAPDGVTVQSAVCPMGSQLLTGSCTGTDIGTLHDLTLVQSGIADTPRGWLCAFRNHETAPVTIKVQVICLQPAP